jgi:hypothetical protein
MARHIYLFCVFLLLASQIHAQTTDNQSGFNLALKIFTQIEVNASSQEEAQKYVQEHSLLVMGHGTDLAELALTDNIKANNPELGSLKEANDTASAMADVQNGKYVLVVLIGGPEQNDITRWVTGKGYLNESQDLYGELTVENGKGNGVAYVVISDREGYVPTLQRQNVASSPLSAFIPPQYVPAAATGITLILLALVNLLKTVVEFKASDIGRKGKKIGEHTMKVMGVDLAEVLAILGASFVLGLSISWQYFANSKEFAYWLVVNTIICLVAGILHELVHRIFAHFFKIKIEYRFWPEGSILTLLSSYLGNAFSVQAFLLEDIPEDVAKWKVGLMKLAAPVVSAIIMVVFAVMNHFTPSPIYKIIYSTSALWAMAEMLPFSGLDGKDIREWSHMVWTVFFVLIAIAYIAVTFLL